MQDGRRGPNRSAPPLVRSSRPSYKSRTHPQHYDIVTDVEGGRRDGHLSELTTVANWEKLDLIDRPPRTGYLAAGEPVPSRPAGLPPKPVTEHVNTDFQLPPVYGLAAKRQSDPDQIYHNTKKRKRDHLNSSPDRQGLHSGTSLGRVRDNTLPDVAPRSLPLDADIGPDKVRIRLPKQFLSQGDGKGMKAALAKWVGGQIDFLKEEESKKEFRQRRRIIRWYYINNRDEFLVEFRPLDQVLQKALLHPKEDAPNSGSAAAAALREMSPDIPLSAFPSQTTQSNLETAELSPKCTSRKAYEATPSTSINASTAEVGSSVLERKALPESYTESNISDDDDTFSELRLNPHSPKTNIIGRDVADSMVFVKPTVHHQVSISGDDPKSDHTSLQEIGLSSKYVVHCSENGEVHFVPRTRPRAPLKMHRQVKLEDFGVLKGMSLTLDSAHGQAILISSGPGPQASIVDFRNSDEFKPSHYVFQERPHGEGGPYSITTLASISSEGEQDDDLGIHFLTGGQNGSIVRWRYSRMAAGMTVQNVTENLPPRSFGGTISCLSSTHTHGIALAGTSLSRMHQLDLAEGHANVLSTVKAHAPITRIHAMTSQLAAAETQSSSMQFLLHDWRTPQAVHRFGFDAPQWGDQLYGTRGDVYGNYFACGDAKGTVRLWDIRNLDGYQSINVALNTGIQQVLFDKRSADGHGLISLCDSKAIYFSTLLSAREEE